MGKDPDKLRKAPLNRAVGFAVAPASSPVASVAIAPQAHKTIRASILSPTLYVNDDEPLPKPDKSWVRSTDGAKQKPANHVAAVKIAPAVTFAQNMVKQARERDLGNYEDPFDRRFLGIFETAATSVSMRKILESSTLNSDIFVTELCNHFRDHARKYYENAEPAYGFLFDVEKERTGNEKPPLKSDIHPQIAGFARQYFEKHKQELVRPPQTMSMAAE